MARFAIGNKNSPTKPVRIVNDSGFSNQGDLDAFGRLRISEIRTLFDSKLIIGKEPLLWAEKLTGSGAITHVTNEAGMDLDVTTASGDAAISQTKSRFNYVPGNSFLVNLTGTFGDSETGSTKKLGYYDNDNGLFFQLKDDVLSVVKRSNVTGSPVDTVITQANWNMDKLDGTGPSRLTLDLTKTQIFRIDFQWLGSGFIRFGFDIDGSIINCHQINNANVITEAYMSNCNLPIRYEIENTGALSAAKTLRQQCATVIIEGENQGTIIPGSVDMGVTGKVTSGTTLIPLLGIRLDPTKISGQADIVSISVVASTNANARWCLILDPTSVGGTPAWIDVPNSVLESDVGAITTIVGGYQMASGYFSQPTSQGFQPIQSMLNPYIDINDVSGEFYLCVQTIGAAPETFFASITYNELR